MFEEEEEESSSCWSRSRAVVSTYGIDPNDETETSEGPAMFMQSDAAERMATSSGDSFAVVVAAPSSSSSSSPSSESESGGAYVSASVEDEARRIVDPS